MKAKKQEGATGSTRPLVSPSLALLRHLPWRRSEFRALLSGGGEGWSHSLLRRYRFMPRCIASMRACESCRCREIHPDAVLAFGWTFVR